MQNQIGTPAGVGGASGAAASAAAGQGGMVAVDMMAGANAAAGIGAGAGAGAAAGIGASGAGAIGGMMAGTGVAGTGTGGMDVMMGDASMMAGTSAMMAGTGSVDDLPVSMGCGDAMLYDTDADPSVKGPWPVGVKTVNVPIAGGMLKTEVWYPATRGSEEGKTKVEYDQRDWLPGSEASKIPDANNKNFVCDCFRDLPVDTAHGPYPVVILIHGTGSFRAASMTTMMHWASRGFIAVAADHYGLYLTDQLGCPGSGILQNLPRDLDAMFAGLTDKTGEIGFLGDSADMTHVGIGGHSQGGALAVDAANRPGVKMLLPLAPLAPANRAKPNLESAITICGMNDSVVGYTASKNFYNSLSVRKHLIGITGGGHLDVSDLCGENSMGQKGIQVANQFGVCNTLLLTTLAQCGTIEPEVGPSIVTYATTAALEETLQCRDRAAAFSMLESKFPAVGEFLEAN